MLKDIIAEDTEKVFFDLDEFAEIHHIGNTPVRCIIDNERLQDVSKKFLDGTFTAEKLVYVSEKDLDKDINVNDSILFDDEIVTVYSVSSEYGMIELMLNKSVGKFNRTVIIQRKSGETKVNGFKVPSTWEDFHTCKAYIRNMNANDMMKIGTIVNSRTIFVKILYVDGITTDMRLCFNGKTYSITSVDNVEFNNEFIDLICEVVE